MLMQTVEDESDENALIIRPKINDLNGRVAPLAMAKITPIRIINLSNFVAYLNFKTNEFFINIRNDKNSIKNTNEF